MTQISKISLDIFLDMLDEGKYSHEEIIQFIFEDGFNAGVKDAQYAQLRGLPIESREI